MGGAKQQMIQDHEDLELAKDVLVAYDYATKCEMHDEFSDVMAGDPKEDTEQLPSMIEELRSAGFSGSDEEAEDVLSRALGDMGDECGFCAKNRDS